MKSNRIVVLEIENDLVIPQIPEVVGPNNGKVEMRGSVKAVKDHTIGSATKCRIANLVIVKNVHGYILPDNWIIGEWTCRNGGGLLGEKIVL
jgi:hypothetical protein